VSAMPHHRAFHVPENPRYGIVESARDSLRFTLTKTLRRDEQGHLVSISSFVDPDGQVMGWHDFGNLEGPGWAANAVGGAWEIWRWGRFLAKRDWQAKALAILDHVLDGGFLDPKTGFIIGYRETTSGKLCLNYKHNSDWLCPGSTSKVAFQLLSFADDLGDDPRARRMRSAAIAWARWLDEHLESVPNGWLPRRCTPAGKVYRKTPEGGDEPFWQTSADGLFVLQLQAALTRRKLADYSSELKKRVAVFMKAGGIFGSINHDTYDPHENVAYSVAFRTLLPVARLLGDERIRSFACTCGRTPRRRSPTSRRPPTPAPIRRAAPASMSSTASSSCAPARSTTSARTASSPRAWTGITTSASSTTSARRSTAPSTTPSPSSTTSTSPSPPSTTSTTSPARQSRTA